MREERAPLCLLVFTTCTMFVIVHNYFHKGFTSVSFTDDCPQCLAYHRKPVKSAEWLDK